MREKLMQKNAMQSQQTPLERFSRCRDILIAANDAAILDDRISSFTGSMDKYMPKRLIHQTVRQILNLEFDEFWQQPYFGYLKRLRFLNLLERIAERITSKAESRTNQILNSGENLKLHLDQNDNPSDHVTSWSWRQWCDNLRNAGLDQQPVGRFVSSLADLPRSLWYVELHEFTSRSYEEILNMPGNGPARINLICNVIRNVALAVTSFASSAHLRVQVCSALIHEAASWVESILQHGEIPTVEELRNKFFAPLFKQLDADLGPVLTEFIRRRLGIDRVPETLEEIALERGLCKERIRQLTSKAADVLLVRWPEGKRLLIDFYELLVSNPDAVDQVSVISSALDEFFGVVHSQSMSRSEVLLRWARAGRTRRTPMTREELHVWCGENVPTLSPEAVARWIMHDAPHSKSEDGRTVYFSHDVDDQLLQRILSSREPVALYDLPEFLDSDERSVRGRLSRDPRFIEDEWKRIYAAELLSVRRHEGRWSVGLVALLEQDQPRRTNISLDCLISMIVAGLTERGVADATVWGVYRFANEVLARLYGARLPSHITPFILSELLVHHSNGEVRHMRRRRLRWDCADKVLTERGKYGWIDYVVTEANIPMTIDELDAALRRYYQDYERYVLTQLSSYVDEDGRGLSETSIIPGIGARIPVVFVSRAWKLNDAAENVSDGIKLIGSRIIANTGRQQFTRQQLQRIPWMISWCERHSYGRMNWADDNRSDISEKTESYDLKGTKSDQERQQLLFEITPPESTTNVGAMSQSDEKIVRILSRFL